ncbi:MAG: hypothetical protein JRH17_08180, partial [Deltaproteobacteria bacterium]|nr:hypothetical protein [Deltaproteobacteria bacterium]
MGPSSIIDADTRPTDETGVAACEGPRARSGRTLWGALALASVATILSFGLQSRLFWDDLNLIGEIDAQVSAGIVADLFASDFFDRTPDSEDAHYYRPLVTASYALGAALWESDPFYYSVSNLLFHLLVCGLLFGLLLRFGASPVVAAGGTTLFGLMPRLTESVFWISGRTDIMATVFVLASLLVYRDDDRAHLRRGAAGMLLFLGLLCKEVAVAGLAGLTLHELARTLERRRRGERIGALLRSFAVHAAPIWTSLFVYMVIRLTVLQGLWQTSLSLGVGSRIGLAAESLGRYALMLLDPVHPALRIGSIFAPRDAPLMALGVIVAIAFLVLFVRLLRRNSESGQLLGLALAGSSLALVLHLLPFGSDVIAADRLLYMPVAGLTLLGTFAFVRLPHTGRRIGGGFAVIAIAVFAVVSFGRAEQWGDDTRLWHHTLSYSDRHDALPHSWMGIALLERDEPRAALVHFEQALRIETSRPPAYRKRSLILELLANTSIALSAIGRDPEALHAIDQALQFQPTDSGYLIQRARILGRLLRFDDAQAALALAISGSGDSPAPVPLAKELRAVAREWNALPKPTASESVTLQATRASLYERLGAMPAAEAIWRDVLARPDAGVDLILAAARFHTFRADPSQAEALIARLFADSDEHDRAAMMLRAA